MKAIGWITILALAGVVLSGGARAQDQRGVIMANTCHSCHGTDGRSVGAMPSIAGKSADYIVDTLKKFRDGKKPSTVMARIAKGFSDAEIVALAKHFAQQ
ncbi:MAG: c-type cytochrome [Alphaproteobacteria bacterium]|jgi:sulfide dehydrogenase cytochrome subunit|nr:c-type cytochrome [Alphaproteobacteria bacterium]